MAVPSRSSHERNQPFQCLFAGNLGQWYGRMLLGLANACREEASLQLRIAGKNAEWNSQDIDQLTNRSIFCGFLKGEQYEAELGRADVLLVLMGFGDDCRQIESTSFKSKLADYLLTGKPILVWGPDYSTAARSARRFGYAEVVDSPHPYAVIERLKDMAADPDRCARIVKCGQLFFEDNLNADKVFDRALGAIQSLIKSRAAGTKSLSVSGQAALGENK